MSIHFVSWSSHTLLFGVHTGHIRRERRSTRDIMVTVHRPGFVTVQPRSVTTEGEKVGKRDGFQVFCSSHITPTIPSRAREQAVIPLVIEAAPLRSRLGFASCRISSKE